LGNLSLVYLSINYSMYDWVEGLYLYLGSP